jgi:hypothetical protein
MGLAMATFTEFMCTADTNFDYILKECNSLPKTINLTIAKYSRRRLRNNRRLVQTLVNASPSVTKAIIAIDRCHRKFGAKDPG